MKRLLLVVVLLVLPACGSGDEVGTSDNPRQVRVAAEEFAFTPESVTITAGETVEFVVTNDGSIDHEFRVMTQAAVDEHIEGGHAEHEDEMGDDMSGEMGDDMSGDDMSGDMDMGHMIVVAPGETKSLTVTFSSSSDLTRYVCLIPGHYEAGMGGELNS